MSPQLSDSSQRERDILKVEHGRVEGINKKLKLLKGGGLGFTNSNNFPIPALLFWHNANI